MYSLKIRHIGKPVFVMALIILLGLVMPSKKAIASDQWKHPREYSAVFGETLRWSECWEPENGDIKVGSLAQLQVRKSNKWTTVYSTRFLKNNGSCPVGSLLVRYKWLVDQLGTQNIPEPWQQGIRTYTLEMRTYFPRIRQVGDLWLQGEYANSTDQLGLAFARIDCKLKGTC